MNSSNRCSGGLKQSCQIFHFSLRRKQDYSFTATGVLVEHSQKRFFQDSLLVGRDLSPVVIELVHQKLSLFKKSGMSGDRQNALDYLKFGLVCKIVVRGSYKQSQHVDFVAVHHCKPQRLSIYCHAIRDQHLHDLDTIKACGAKRDTITVTGRAR